MKRIFFIIIQIFLLTAFTFNTKSQDIKVQAKLDSNKNKISIGDQIKFIIQASYPAKTLITWPDYKDTLSSHIEIIQKSKIDTISNDGKKITLAQSYIITSFDSGNFYTPCINFKFKKAGDTAFFEALTDSLLLNVNTITVDTTKVIKDIKEPMSVPWTLKEMLPYIIGAIILAAIVWFVIYYIRKRRKGESLFGFSKPKLSPFEEAIIALDSLKNKKLWQNNKIKEYYTELTDIIRTYIERRFEIIALEMTTDEITSTMRNFDISDKLKSKLNQILIIADLVKFAKALPLPNEHDICLENAYEFVKETKPVVVPENMEEQQNNNNINIQETIKSDNITNAK